MAGRRWWQLAAAAAVALTVATAGPSQAAGPTVNFTASFVDHGTTPYGVHSCSATQTGGCDLKFNGSAYLTGKLSTFVDYFGYLWINPATQQGEAESWDHHTGSLAGCGSGSFVLHQTEARGPVGYNLAAGTFRLTLKWQILPGSGTGAFRDATGSGTAQGDFTPTLANTGTYTGTISCPHGGGSES